VKSSERTRQSLPTQISSSKWWNISTRRQRRAVRTSKPGLYVENASARTAQGASSVRAGNDSVVLAVVKDASNIQPAFWISGSLTSRTLSPPASSRGRRLPYRMRFR
jgi:hypothetical protein